MKGIDVIVIPASAKWIAAGAFSGLKDLRSVVFSLDSQLETIGVGCFRDGGLEEIRFPRSLVEIGEDAFQGCTNLKSAVFEEGSALQRVGKGAFAGTPLRPVDVNFPENVDVAKAFGLTAPEHQ